MRFTILSQISILNSVLFRHHSSLVIFASFRHGERRIAISIINVRCHHAARRDGSPWLRCRHRRDAPSPSRSREQLRFRRKRFRHRRKQHAAVLHRRRSRPQDLADGGARDEPLLHRLRHCSARVR